MGLIEYLINFLMFIYYSNRRELREISGMLTHIRTFLGVWNIFRESRSKYFPVYVCSFQFPSGKQIKFDDVLYRPMIEKLNVSLVASLSLQHIVKTPH